MFEGSDKFYHIFKKITGITITIAFMISLLNLLAAENYNLLLIEKIS